MRPSAPIFRCVGSGTDEGYSGVLDSSSISISSEGVNGNDGFILNGKNVGILIGADGVDKDERAEEDDMIAGAGWLGNEAKIGKKHVQ